MGLSVGALFPREDVLRQETGGTKGLFRDAPEPGC